MKLSDYARKQGVSYRTAHRWFKDGKIPCSVEQMPSGAIIVHENNKLSIPLRVCIYTRVSTYERKNNLTGQAERCATFANAKGLSVTSIYKEVASGMNDSRPKLWKMIASKPTHIIIENKDRLTRFGFNYLSKLLKEQGCEVLVLNEEHEDEKDLMKDMVAIITSFCCRLYGLRRCRNKINAIKKELLSDK